jgi:glycosyltransferase involved in cell wall biosynthesis
MLPVTIWMNMPSFYQDDLFRALADKVDLRVVFDHALTPDRRRLGWQDEAVRGYCSRVLSPSCKVAAAERVAHAERKRLHLFGGIWAQAAFAAAALVLGMHHAQFAIYAEAPNDRISRSGSRRALRVAFGGWVARRAVGLLAISHFAEDYYGTVGFTPGKIYPFGYFRESPASQSTVARRDILDIAFVGQFIHRKGIDVLLEAITPVLADYPALRLSLIGTGPKRENFEEALRTSGVADRVTFEGIVPSTQMHDRLGRAGLLVLPSRWDGWGIVVNEAFAAGIPVIASDRCGASDLIRHGVNGYVFRNEDAADLRACLRAFLSADRKQMRAAAVQTSSALAIPVVTDYLVACLEHMSGIRADRPKPPWLENFRVGIGTVAQLS